MVKAKPTPMPWELRGWSIKHPGNGFRICIVEQPDKALRQFGGGDYDDMMDECRANAELIARAPMLAHANVQQAEEIKALAARLAEAEAKLKEIDTKAGGFISTDPRANNFAKWLRLVAGTADSASVGQGD